MLKLRVVPNVISYTAAISACAACAEWQHALSIFGDMRRDRVQPNTITFTAAISACKHSVRALDLLEEMKQYGFSPNVITYSAAMSACERDNQWELALKILAEMKTVRVEPNVVTYSIAISACQKRATFLWPQVLDFLDEMSASNLIPNGVTCSYAMSALVTGRQWELALKVYSRMVAMDVQPNLSTMKCAIKASEMGSQTQLTRELLAQTSTVQKNTPFAQLYPESRSVTQQCLVDRAWNRQRFNKSKTQDAVHMAAVQGWSVRLRPKCKVRMGNARLAILSPHHMYWVVLALALSVMELLLRALR